MKNIHSKNIIIGAGLSGLVAAHFLTKAGEKEFILLEARSHIGGRIKTHKKVDLGATWFQDHHSHLYSLLQELNLESFSQYSAGKSVLIYNTMAPPHFFEIDSKQPSASRIVGGSLELIETLAEGLESKLHLNQEVKTIENIDNHVKITTSNISYTGDKVIVCLPPKIASKFNFRPKLPEGLIQQMAKTHTWMSNALKVGISFESAFWREKGMSGTLIGQVGPIVELYDHSCVDGETHSLMGFVNEGLRDLTSSERKEKILVYLEKYFGSEIRDHIHYFEKDWSGDRFTNQDQLHSVYMSPQYGNPVFEKTYMADKLLFSGTETANEYGGYLEGAIISGKSAAQWLLANSTTFD